MKGKDIQIGVEYYCNPSPHGRYTYRSFIAKPVAEPGAYYETHRSSWSRQPSELVNVADRDARGEYVSPDDRRHANTHVLCVTRSEVGSPDSWSESRRLVPLRHIVQPWEEAQKEIAAQEARRKKARKERKQNRERNRYREEAIRRALVSLVPWMDGKYLWVNDEESEDATMKLDFTTVEKMLGILVNPTLETIQQAVGSLDDDEA